LREARLSSVRTLDLAAAALMIRRVNQGSPAEPDKRGCAALLISGPGEKCFTFTLSPGDARYMTPRRFMEENIEELIAHLRNLSETPRVVPPRSMSQYDLTGKGSWLDDVCFSDVDDLFRDQLWNQRLSIYQQVCLTLAATGMPFKVYYCWHRHLELDSLALSECSEAWIRDSLYRTEIVESYRESPDDLLIQGYKSGEYYSLAARSSIRDCRTSEEFVFKRTPFVNGRLLALASQAKVAAEEAARIEAARLDDEVQKRAELDIEALRKIRFDSYLYVMEDSRNGLFKIGRSKTPGKRERTLQSEAPSVCLRIAVPAEEQAEQRLHSRFAPQSVRGEWFSLSKDDVVWIVAYLKSNGDASRASVDFDWLGRSFFGAGE
jgi:T5orf172 domain